MTDSGGVDVGARLQPLGQGWRKVRPYLAGAVVVLVVAAAILALIYVPKWQVPVCPPGKEALPPKICFDIENEARRTLAYILGGILAIIGITLAHQRIRALEHQVQVAQEGQVTERFTRAIEQLGNKEMAIRLGGIYALERIANDSDKDYWPIMETLTACVRERASWREPPQDSPVPTFPPKPATDIQTVLTVLGRRKYRYGQGETERLDLRGTDLRGGELIMEAHLEGAILGAHLEKADLSFANMQEAILPTAHLEWADLFFTNLHRALLDKAHLEGVDLSTAIGLTKEQLTHAILDDKTILPDYLQEEPPEAPGPVGSSEE